MATSIEKVMSRMRGYGPRPALFWRGREYDYDAFFGMIGEWEAELARFAVGPGAVVAVVGEFSPRTCALFFALMQVKAVIVPLTPAIEAEIPERLRIAGVQHLFRIDDHDEWVHQPRTAAPQNALIEEFRGGPPGLVVFTSGSTGEPKGILQDCERVMRKFEEERRGWRTILFLMMDHFGGFNTFLSAFAYGGVAVCVADRSPGEVCRTIRDAAATLLPTTPTFLNLLIASRAYKDFDLSSVELITYGTEVMPDATLAKVREIFPSCTVKQTYGLSELGVLRSKSRSDDSPWVKIGGDGFEVKVVDDTLWVRSEANMVGYLNAPSPIDADGWMCTGDRVEVDGDYLRIRGRASDMINVGGQKVFPVEVETVLLQAPNVVDAAVVGAPHPILGRVVHARITLAQPEERRALGERLRSYCASRLAKYKIPVRFQVVEGGQHNARYKKVRSAT